MSYTTKHRIGLGSAAGDVVNAAVKVVEDPCLGPAAALILRLNALIPSTKGGPPSKGIGMCSLITPLKTVIAVKEKPWLLPVGGAVIFLGLFGLGYAMGRRRR